ncbi:MAG: LexA family transcriptional regulator [Muribaculaceae bacterium]|jgi:SOS-response transcriptional repressor LexA|nr:LexA family transcriptional regulator [Bacteroidales bacterium]MBQ1486126.1 LexA family transcriptional regulator [Muribaculaceae bacterium]MBQ1746424.1 LexA family transcriptional regulator [Muribaculaceae bacterium]
MEKEKNAEIIDRIKYLMKEMGLKQVQFAERIGVDTSNLSKYLNAHMPLSESFLNRLVVNLGVSKEWLLDGTDLPFGKTPVRVDGEVMASANGGGTPVYDVDVTAGVASGRNELFASENIVGWVNLPNMSPNCRIVRVSGDSMAPVINDGDFVAVREVSNPNQIYWGQIYVVQLDDFRLVKYLRRHSDPNMVVLRSENPNYDDMDVRRSDIHEMLLVQHVLHLNTRL